MEIVSGGKMGRLAAAAAALAHPEVYHARPIRRVRARPARVGLWHGKGRCHITEHSSLRKMMRAARRGKVPQERIGVIVRAMQSAAERPLRYMHSKARQRHVIALRDAAVSA